MAAIGVLGFAAGRYSADDSRSPPGEVDFPEYLPSGPPSSGPQDAAAAAPQKIPTTLREIMKLDGDFTQSAALYLLAASQDKQGIKRLLQEAETIDRGSERRAAASILYQRYADLDPEGAVDHMMRRDAGLDPNWLYGVFYSWARSDLDGALAQAATLDDQNRHMAGMAIVRSRDDLPDTEREALGSKLNLQDGIHDPAKADLRSPRAAERAWQRGLAIADRNERLGQLYGITQQWAKQDPQAAIRAIESLRERGQRDQLLQLALSGWAEKDARQAVEWTLAQPPSQQRAELLGGAFAALVMKEPATATAMMERLSPAERRAILPEVLMNWANVDPQAAAAWAEKQGDREMLRHAFAMIASTFAERDPEEALRWASSLSGEHSQVVMSQVIQQVAYNDPERAASFVSQLDDGPQRESSIAAIAQLWAQSDPRSALAWAARQSQGEARPDVYRAVFGQWAAYDADAAMSQLNFILGSDTRNGAILGMLEAQYLDPELVVPLYQRLEGADARRQAAATVYYRLREVDLQTAEQYRLEAGISNENAPGDGIIIVN